MGKMKDVDIELHNDAICSNMLGNKEHSVSVRVYEMELQPVSTSVALYVFSGDLEKLRFQSSKMNIGPEDHATIVNCCCLDAAASVGVQDVEGVGNV